ncbi:MAG: hypothetical protein EAZ67_04495 [Cytophagales bacterium]|nr:MAG: hypothetical protein EAZ67_04495 [Cytophagales bacterium]
MIHSTAEIIKPQIITLEKPILGVCKHVKGDYVRSQHYVQEIQRQLIAFNIPFIPMAVVGVYFDDPRQTPPDEQKSLQGVLVETLPNALPEGFEALSMDGKFLHISTSDPQKLGLAYHKIIEYAIENNLQLASPHGKQIATFANNNFLIDIYFELS